MATPRADIVPSYTLPGDGIPKPVTLYGPNGAQLEPKDFTHPWGPGPLQPLPVGFGSRQPLSWNYPISWNIQWTPRSEEGIPNFPTLRRVTKACDELNIVIQYRLDGISAKKLSGKAREKPLTVDAKRLMAKKIKDVDTWLERPFQGLSMRGAQCQLGYEVFVTDGVMISLERAVDGSPMLPRQVAPETLKPLLEASGEIVGYQQIIWGQPRTEYPAFRHDTELDDRTPQILGPHYTPTVASGYGTSHVEDILNTVDILTRFQLLERANFTAGTVPPAYITTPAAWSLAETQAWYKWLNDEYAGDLAYKARLLALPYGCTVQAVHQDPFAAQRHDAFLSDLCVRFNTPRNLFLNTGTRSAADEVTDALQDSGLVALQSFFINDIFNPILWFHFEEPEVEIVYSVDPTKDRAMRAAERKTYFEMVDAQGARVMDVNEVRGEIGLDALTDAQIAQQTEAKRQADDAAVAAVRPIAAKEEEGEGKEKETGEEREDGEGDGETTKITKQKLVDLLDELDVGAERAETAERSAWLAFGKKHLSRRGRAPEDFEARSLPVAEAFGTRRLMKAAKTEDQVRKAARAPLHRYTKKNQTVLETRMRRAAAKYLSACKRAILAGMKPAEKIEKAAGEWELMGPSVSAARDTFLDEMKAILSETFRLSAKAARAGADKDGTGIDWHRYDEHALAYARRRSSELVTEIDDATRNRLREINSKGIAEAMGQDEISRMIEDDIGFSKTRSDLIARTELSFAENRGPLVAYRDMGITHVEVFDGDGDDECAQANGEIWTIDRADSEPIGHPNCLRAFAPVAPEDLGA